MNEKTKAFLQELTALCAKHGVQLNGADQYDGEERFCGTIYRFEGTDFRSNTEVYLEMSDIVKATDGRE